MGVQGGFHLANGRGPSANPAYYGGDETSRAAPVQAPASRGPIILGSSLSSPAAPQHRSALAPSSARKQLNSRQQAGAGASILNPPSISGRAVVPLPHDRDPTAAAAAAARKRATANANAAAGPIAGEPQDEAYGLTIGEYMARMERRTGPGEASVAGSRTGSRLSASRMGLPGTERVPSARQGSARTALPPSGPLDALGAAWPSSVLGGASRSDLRPGTTGGGRTSQDGAVDMAAFSGPGAVVMTDLGNLSSDLFSPSAPATDASVQRLSVDNSGYSDIFDDGASNGSEAPSPKVRAPLPVARPAPAAPHAHAHIVGAPHPHHHTHPLPPPAPPINPVMSLGLLASLGLGERREREREDDLALPSGPGSNAVALSSSSLAPRKAFSAGSAFGFGFGFDIRPPSRQRPPNESMDLFSGEGDLLPIGLGDVKDLAGGKKKGPPTVRPQTALVTPSSRFSRAKDPR